jgi:hypothetical protein
MTFALLLGALLAAGCVVLVALPYLREPSTADDVLDEPGELERRQLELSEVRDRALAALKELELDHRTGKVSEIPEPYPPPGELDPPQPPEIPEPYPPPGELDPPEPPQIPEPGPL